MTQTRLLAPFRHVPSPPMCAGYCAVRLRVLNVLLLPHRHKLHLWQKVFCMRLPVFPGRAVIIPAKEFGKIAGIVKAAVHRYF